jgi:hypothetical protein
MSTPKLTRRNFLKRSTALGTACLTAAAGSSLRAAGRPPRVRRDLGEFVKDPKARADLVAAVKKMRALDPDQPFSWIFQANRH